MKIPHIIHGCPCDSYPTHTHGLEDVTLPEMFINGKAFGTKVNANIINNIFDRLKNRAIEFVRVGSLKIGDDPLEFKLWKESDMVICIRIVDKDFAGVKTAYHDNNVCKTGYAQIFVKGDDHVLTDKYFLNEAAMGCGEKDKNVTTH